MSMDRNSIDHLSLEQLLQCHLSCEVIPAWTIHDSHVHGQGLFASRDIEEGEVIFKDVALVLGPRSGATCPPVCLGCLSSSNTLYPCTLCGLPVCSSICQNSAQHQQECAFLRKRRKDTAGLAEENGVDRGEKDEKCRKNSEEGFVQPKPQIEKFSLEDHTVNGNQVRHKEKTVNGRLGTDVLNGNAVKSEETRVNDKHDTVNENAVRQEEKKVNGQVGDYTINGNAVRNEEKRLNSRLGDDTVNKNTVKHEEEKVNGQLKDDTVNENAVRHEEKKVNDHLESDDLNGNAVKSEENRLNCHVESDKYNGSTSPDASSASVDINGNVTSLLIGAKDELNGKMADDMKAVVTEEKEVVIEKTILKDLVAEDARAKGMVTLDAELNPKVKESGVKEDTRINLDLLRSVTPIRCLRMSKLKRKIMRSLEAQHFQICEIDLLKRHLHLSSSEEAYLRLCCGILDTNAYGGSGTDDTCLNFRGLYALSAIMNHACRPNTTYWFDSSQRYRRQIEKLRQLNFRGLYALSAIMNHACRPNTTYWFDSSQRMVVKASVRIASGDEILSTYSSLLWSTASRRSFLRNTKGFECRCARCKDPTEFGSHLSAIYCKMKPCPGLLLPSNPLDIAAPWFCTAQRSKDHELPAAKAFQMINICSKVAQMLTETEDLQQISTFLKSVPPFSQTAVQIHKHFVLHSPSQISDITKEKLLFKEESCYKLLELMTKLKLGANYLRGLILQELYRVLEEKSRRFPAEHTCEETLDQIRREFEIILRF